MIRLYTKDGDKFICPEGRIWTAKWASPSGTEVLTLRCKDGRTKHLIMLGDFQHAFDAEGMKKVAA